ncbi:MAG: dienelactone hydrolase family protein [Alphaproteobacteria bacterium]|nr:dienelactone hydrolase family protein [Alphaproteobacteria bacterium]
MTIHLQGPDLAPTSGTVKRLVILLHGLGSDGNDLIGLAPLMKEALPDTHFISPNAPFPCDMAPYGHQWFSLQDRSLGAMLKGVRTVAPIVNQFIDAQRDRFKLRDADIALLGFSQGTMTSLYVGPRRSKPLAGIVGFSGAMIGADLLHDEIRSKPPVCLIHGEEDMVVPFAAMQHATYALATEHVEVESHARPYLPHSIDPEGLDIAVNFLKKCFGI